MGKTIDAEELLNRIKKLDPCFYDSVQMKWKVHEIITEMAQEQTDDTETKDE